MLQEELNDLIESLKDAESETSFVEIKSCEGGFPKKIWETVSAFANSATGGVIILGIREADNGITIAGVKNPARFQKDLQEVCSRMNPPLRPMIQIHKYQGKLLVTVEIPAVSYKEKPCYYEGSGIISGSFIRVGESDRRLTQYEVQSLIDGRGQPRYDVDPVLDASVDDLDADLLALFLKKVREDNRNAKDWPERKILTTYRILTDFEKKEAVTLCGLLCFGRYPQQFFPGLVTHVLVYPENEEGQLAASGERLLDNVKIEGNMLRAIPETIRAIKRNIQKRSMVKGLFREDILEYPEVFLREAIINAVAHRDYAPLARGTAVQIKIFPNRIEVSSPGGLFGPMTEEDLGRSGLQATRNSYLIKLLEDSPVPDEGRVLCENRGTGIPSMIHALRKAGMEPPQFKSIPTQFRVTCFNHALFDGPTLKWLEKYASFDLNDRQRFALAYLLHKEKLNNPEYARMNDCDSRVAGKELGELVAKRLMIQHGSRRWAFYTLAVPGRASAHKRGHADKAKRKDRQDEILDIFRTRGECSRREIQEALGLEWPAAYYWIKKLIKEELLERTTGPARSPSVKYRLKV